MATRSMPQPPFSAELLADLHADNVTPELSEQLWPAVRRDPAALRYLDALDDVSADLRNLGHNERIIHAMPDDIAARLDQFIDNLDPAEETTEQVATIHRLPFADAGLESAGAPPAPVPDAPTAVVATPISLDDRRRRRLRWLAGAAAAVAVVACATVALSTLRGNQVAPTAQPSTGTVELGDELTSSATLTVLGRNDVTGALASPAALNRCVHANGLDRMVLGSTNTTFQGKNAVLILLTGPRPHKITALVVGTGCTAGDSQQLAMQDIG